MKTAHIFNEASRNLARLLFQNRSRNRTVSKVTADYFGTDTQTVHLVVIITIIALWLNIKK